MVLEELDRWASHKGLNVMGTGDFTHPAWFKEIKEKLEPAEQGLFKLKKEYKQLTWFGDFSDTRFILTVEISGIYKRNGKVRRIHNLVFAPDIKTVEKINTQLGWIGNLKSDGRPILGLDSEELAKLVFNINPAAVIVPAHAWTPWFSIFGSMSGFDSLEECFGEYAKNIFAIETGLSSDPAMNWRWSKLDNIALISNSDSHSLQRIGREANVFDTDLSYDGIMSAIKANKPNKFLMTAEFFPEEGKYHFDGHRVCGVSFSPDETKKHKNICPKCGKTLTIGVLNRVDALADRPESHKSTGRVSYKSIVPLDEIIAESFSVGTASKKVKAEYEKLIKNLGGELKIVLDVSGEEIKKIAAPLVAEGIMKVRAGEVSVEPGFDGEYGKIKIFGSGEQKVSTI
ncbi:MAG: DNA helicase UvrD [Candidatus Brennerbacteria bacterium]|nr:DNA helicase UvrD [Candidatus Brennerbacteria bacterium]